MLHAPLAWEPRRHGSGTHLHTSGLVQPVFPAYHPDQRDDSDREADELLRRLEQRRALQQQQHQRVASPPRSKVLFVGDRGTLSNILHSTGGDSLMPSQLAPTRPASPSLSAANSQIGGLEEINVHPGDLPREVSAREQELLVLRSKVEAREVEASQLRDQVREAELSLQQVSGTVGALSAKVEATSGNRHAVLEASAQHIDSQVRALLLRLARTDSELSEKDQEIDTLRRAVEVGSRRVEEQRRSLLAVHKSHTEYRHQAAAHEEDMSRLQRHRAIGEWRERVQTQIAREEQDASLAFERRERERQARALDEDIASFRAFVARMEEKCWHHTTEMQRHQQNLEDFAMDERLCLSKASLGHEASKKQKQYQMHEQKALEARIQDEIQRKAARAGHAQAYDAIEADARRSQDELAALIACTREVSRTLQSPPYERFQPQAVPPTMASLAASTMTRMPMAGSPPMFLPLQLGASPLLKI